MISMNNKILTITAHPDDCELMFGGLIAKHIRQGYEVHSLIITNGDKWISEPMLKTIDRRKISEFRKNEAIEAMRTLGVKNVVFLDQTDGMISADAIIPLLLSQVGKINPHFIFTHSDNEGHYDHHAVHNAVMRICNIVGEPCPICNSFWADVESACTNFEALYTTANTSDIGIRPCIFIPLDFEDVETKMKAVMKYESQFYGRMNDIQEKITSEATYLGTLVNRRYAEVIQATYPELYQIRELVAID